MASFFSNTLWGFEILVVVLVAIFLILWALGIIAKTKVEPGKLVLFTYGADLAYGAMSFPGKSFNQNGIIVPSLGPSKYQYCDCLWIISWKSWVFYFTWLVEPVKYDKHNNPDGFGSDIYIDLADHFVTVQVKNAETKDITSNGKTMAGPALSFDIQGIGAIVDPRNFVIASPPDVFQKGIADETEACARRLARFKSEEEILNMGVGSQIWEDFMDPAQVNAKIVFDIMEERWGFKFAKDSITLKNVSYSESYQKARQAEKEGMLAAKGVTARVFDPVKDAIASGISADNAVRLQELHMGGQVVDFNVRSNDKSIDPATLVLGGGGVGFMAGNKGGKGDSGKSGRKGGKKGKPGDDDRDIDEKIENAFD